MSEANIARTPRAWWTDTSARIRIALIVAGALVLLVTAAFQESPLQPLVVFLACLALALVSLWRLAGGAQRAFLIDLFLGAFLLRVVAIVASHGVLLSLGTGGFVFPDDRAYDELSWDIARAWSGEIPGILQRDSYLVMNYTYLLGLLYLLLGHSVVAAKVLNAAFGAVTALATFGIARELWDERAARLAGIVAAIFPSLLLWSLLTLKDVMVVMVASIAIWTMLRFVRHADWKAAIVGLLALATMEDLRAQLFLLIGWLMVVGVFAASTAPWRTRLRRGVPYAVATIAVIYLLGFSQLGLEFLTISRFQQMERQRADDTARTQLGGEQRPESGNAYVAQVAYLPIGLPNVILQPVPWTMRTPRDFAFLPEVICWYLIVVASLAGVVEAARKRHRAALLLGLFVLLMMMAFALVQNNVGTLIRHRAMLLPVMIPLGAPFLLLLWGRIARRAVSEP